jgi:hypothetical protein
MMIRVRMPTPETGMTHVTKPVQIRIAMKKAAMTIQAEQEVPEVLLPTARNFIPIHN